MASSMRVNESSTLAIALRSSSRLDKNKDGKLTVKEVGQSKTLEFERLRRGLLPKYDGNDDGVVTRAEFEATLRARGPGQGRGGQHGRHGGRHGGRSGGGHGPGNGGGAHRNGP